MKQVIVVRKDLEMSPGKMGIQMAHAAVKSFKLHMKNQGKLHGGMDCINYVENTDLVEWNMTGEAKIGVWCKNINQFEKILVDARDAGINVAMIIDEGRTELKPNTITCMALGPAEDKLMNSITGKLQLIK